MARALRGGALRSFVEHGRTSTAGRGFVKHGWGSML